MIERSMALEATFVRWINKHSAWFFLFVVTVSLLYARIRFFNHQSADFIHFLERWYDHIDQIGFSAFGKKFSDYSMLYLYLLYIGTKLKLSAIVAIKALSVGGDFLLAVYGAKIIQHVTGSKLRASVGYCLILACPTVLINGAYWAQCDSIYTAFCLASILHALRARYRKSLVFYGIAFCFKLQAVFLFPPLLVMALRGFFPLHYLLYGPLLYILVHVPTLLAGAKIRYIFFETYIRQTSAYKQMTLNAPSIWSLFPPIPSKYLRGFTLLGEAWLLIGCYAVYAVKNIKVNLLFFTFFSLFVPYVLPMMHERYFFMADVLTLIYAATVPRRFYVPILVVLASLLSYGPFLFGATILPFPLLSAMMGTALALLAIDLWHDMFPAGVQATQR